MALFATGFAIQSALRMRGEETSGRAEPVLAAALSRVRWEASHLALALGGSVVTLGAAGLGLGSAHAIGSGDAAQLPRLVAAALVQLPAVWVLAAVATALFGLVPRAAAAAWAVLGACFVLWVVGPIANAPAWLMDVSPYTHVPALPAADFTRGPLFGLLAVAAAITAVGIAGFRRRDVGF
jgi:ABC-2 type transport system permease protein